MKLKSYAFSLFVFGFLAFGLMLGGLTYASGVGSEETAAAAPIFKKSLNGALSDFNSQPRKIESSRPVNNEDANMATFKVTCRFYNTCQSDDCVFPTVDPSCQTSDTVSCLKNHQQEANMATFKVTCRFYNTCQSDDCVFPTVDPSCPQTSDTVSCLRNGGQ